MCDLFFVGVEGMEEGHSDLSEFEPPALLIKSECSEPAELKYILLNKIFYKFTTFLRFYIQLSLVSF